MRNFSQASTKLTATQYSTIYDLEKLIVRVYLFNDHSEFVEIDLKKELKKGNHSKMIPELFSTESAGYQHYLKYNDENHPTLFIEELIGDAVITEAEYKAMGFEAMIKPMGYEWLYSKKIRLPLLRFFNTEPR